MRNTDRQAFATMVGAVYELYLKTVSEDSLGIWWGALAAYDLAAVREALNRHVSNPDSGQFLPKPADVVKMLGGSTLDSALLAWAKVQDAMERLGRYHTVAFEDPLIHRVIEEMGGWIVLCAVTFKDLAFRQNEFLNRYRSYRGRGEVPPYPAKLKGMFDLVNNEKGYPDGPVLAVGDPASVKQVIAAGSLVPLLEFTPLPVAEAAAPGVAALEHKGPR